MREQALEEEKRCRKKILDAFGGLPDAAKAMIVSELGGTFKPTQPATQPAPEPRKKIYPTVVQSPDKPLHAASQAASHAATTKKKQKRVTQDKKDKKDKKSKNKT